MTVRVDANDVVYADATLGVYTLPTVTVQSAKGEIIRMPAGLAERMRNGMGHYITLDEIERRRPIRTSDLLRGIAGVQVSTGGIVFNTRGVTSLVGPQYRSDALGNRTISAPAQTGCMSGMSAYTDGVPVASDSTSGGIDLVLPADIVAIEVYKSPIEMSMTLPQSPCGAIFIWTR